MKVLVIGPHPDDAEYGAGGFIAGCNRLSGVSADIACFAGAPETPYGDPSSDLDTVRTGEAARAAGILGAALLPLPASSLGDKPEAVLALVRLFRQQRPDLVLSVPHDDTHPFHRSVSNWTSEAVFAATLGSYADARAGPPLSTPPQLWYMDAYSAPHLPPTHLVNVTPWYAIARRALLAHETGLRITPGLDYQMRARHAQLGSLAAVPMAEGFTPSAGLGQSWLAQRVAALRLLVELHAATSSAKEIP